MTSVLFDLDGTLVNSSPGILAAFLFDYSTHETFVWHGQYHLFL